MHVERVLEAGDLLLLLLLLLLHGDAQGQSHGVSLPLESMGSGALDPGSSFGGTGSGYHGPYVTLTGVWYISTTNKRLQHEAIDEGHAHAAK